MHSLILYSTILCVQHSYSICVFAEKICLLALTGFFNEQIFKSYQRFVVNANALSAGFVNEPNTTLKLTVRHEAFCGNLI